MPLAEFFSRIPTITLRYPLAELLGAADEGQIEYSFADAVRLAGHSCPTVAGAWLMSCRALRTLYGSETPVRGDVAVALHESLDTGAAGDGGFKGLGGQYVRRGLLSFGAAEVVGMRFTRLDTGAAVDAIFRPQGVAADPRLGELLPLVISGSASGGERELFGKLWQDRVKRLLIDHHDDPAIVEITTCR